MELDFNDLAGRPVGRHRPVGHLGVRASVVAGRASAGHPVDRLAAGWASAGPALLTALLLPALLAHLVVRHGEFSFAEAFRATTILLHLPKFRSGEMRLAGMPEQRRERTVSPNYRHLGSPSRALRPQNGLLAMVKRIPHSGTSTPRSGPDRSSLLMGTASTAAVPVIARGAQAQTSPTAPTSTINKPVDIALTINDREHRLSV